jgi:excinuclease UvrABC ATPase subunit
MSSNRFGLVEIVEVIRTSDQVETVNGLENVVSIDIDTIVREPRGIRNSATKHKDFSRIMVFNNSGNALLPNNYMNNSFND